MVATSAIGMGMNLNINRVIFLNLENIGGSRRYGHGIQITESEIQQIAGRAGRFTNVGYVTSFNEKDLPIIKKALQSISKVKEDYASIREKSKRPGFQKNMNLISSK